MVWLAARVVVLAVSIVVLVVRSSPLTDPLGTRTPSPPGFFGVLAHWDSGYFLDIAQHGYFQPGAFPGLPALFPGYPMLARLLAAPFGGGVPATVAAMAVVSAVASMIAGVLIWRLAEVTGRPGAAPWAAALLLAGPYAVFLSANYAEALFCALAISAWYLALRDRWWWVAVLAGLAAVTRVNGLFLIAALVVTYVLASRRAGLSLLRWQSLWPLVSVSGIAGYFVWLAVRTGDVFAWMTAQRIGWGREFHWPWSAFYQTAGRVLYASTVDRRFQFALDLLAGRCADPGLRRLRATPDVARVHLCRSDTAGDDDLVHLRLVGP